MVSKITVEQLSSRLLYNQDTGEFHWVSGPNSGRLAGSIEPNGYRRIKIDGTRHYAHRLAWLWKTGEWPRGQIDHINRQKDDNRICNLREATPSQNRMNSKSSGVRFRPGLKKPYRAVIKVSGKSMHLGYFPTHKLARQAYLAASKTYFGEFASAQNG